jgi:thioredoxin-like negative regulator of GroEL|tara:strand:- start:573 stop:758 length:186 start_codon:yes stop_codon:yes gene_type:complete
MEEVAGEESIIVEFIDVDNEQNKAEKYKVTAVPTIVVEENGIVIDRIIGVITKQQILERLM